MEKTDNSEQSAKNNVLQAVSGHVASVAWGFRKWSSSRMRPGPECNSLRITKKLRSGTKPRCKVQQREFNELLNSPSSKPANQEFVTPRHQHGFRDQSDRNCRSVGSRQSVVGRIAVFSLASFITIVHAFSQRTFDFLYERRRQNSHNSRNPHMTFAKNLMHFQPLGPIQISKFSGESMPPDPPSFPAPRSLTRGTSSPGGGGGRVLNIFLGGGVPPSPENPYPISDQNILFSIPYFRPNSQNVYPISDPVRCGNFSNSQWIYGVRDLATPQTMFAVFFLRDQYPRQHTLL